jgi:hypothetical protein
MKIDKYAIVYLLFLVLVFAEGVGILLLGMMGILQNGYLGAIIIAAAFIGLGVFVIGQLTAEKHIEKDERVNLIIGTSSRNAFLSMIVVMMQFLIFEFVTGITVSAFTMAKGTFLIAMVVYIATFYILKYR